MLEAAEKYCPNVAVWRTKGTGVSGLIINSHLDSLDITALNTLMENTDYKVKIGGFVGEDSNVEIEVSIHRGQV